jgi:hypothetical protein
MVNGEVLYERTPKALQGISRRGCSLRRREKKLWGKTMKLYNFCEYLDETHPNPPILPRDPAGRARVRVLALAVEIQPVVGKGQNYLASVLKASEEHRAEWIRHFSAVGFRAIETLLANSKETGRF